MFKKNKLVVLASVLVLLAAGLWLVVGRIALANPSNATYRMPTYEYAIEIDTRYDDVTNSMVEDGILIHLNPDRPTKGASAFSDAYSLASRECAQKWVAEGRTGPVDLMIIFNRPLSLREANSILVSVNADVFESAIVGYRDGIPFAGYSVEEGPLLIRSLSEYAEMGVGGGVEPEITEDNKGDLVRTDSDVRGYLAVRAWVSAQSLDDLLNHKDVRVVDTTPQEVRDQVAEHRDWQHKTITNLAVEMPVWAYEWK